MVFHPDIKVLTFAFYIRYIPSNKNKCTTTIDIMKYFAWLIGFMTVTAVELFQKVVLTQSHICIQLYDANATGEQKMQR